MGRVSLDGCRVGWIVARSSPPRGVSLAEAALEGEGVRVQLSGVSFGGESFRLVCVRTFVRAFVRAGALCTASARLVRVSPLAPSRPFQAGPSWGLLFYTVCFVYAGVGFETFVNASPRQKSMRNIRPCSSLTFFKHRKLFVLLGQLLSLQPT